MTSCCNAQVVILYGNWVTQGAKRPAHLSKLGLRKGRRPNLRHQEPTPNASKACSGEQGALRPA